MSELWFHEIAESEHRIQNPVSLAKIMRLAQICQVDEFTRVLDLACGKGEMLCQWALHHDIKATGVDISEALIQSAKERSDELKVWSQLNFDVSDAKDYVQPFHQYDIVSCIGATWIGGGLVGTLKLMAEALKDPDDGLLLVGDVFWKKEPTPEVCKALEIEKDYIPNLSGISDRFDEAGVELLEMLISNDDEWDDYYSTQWMTVSRYLRRNPEFEKAAELRQWIDHHRRIYLKYDRQYLGWGIFVTRLKD